MLTVAEEMDRVMEMMAVHGRSSQFMACHKKWRENGWGKGWIKWESTPLYGSVLNVCSVPPAILTVCELEWPVRGIYSPTRELESVCKPSPIGDLTTSTSFLYVYIKDFKVYN